MPKKSIATKKASHQVRISKVRGRARTNLKHHSGKGASLNAASEIWEGDLTWDFSQQLLTHAHVRTGVPKATAALLAELPPAQAAKAPS